MPTSRRPVQIWIDHANKISPKMMLGWLKGIVFETTLEKSEVCRFEEFIWTTIQMSSVYYKILHFFHKKLSSYFRGGNPFFFSFPKCKSSKYRESNIHGSSWWWERVAGPETVNLGICFWFRYHLVIWSWAIYLHIFFSFFGCPMAYGVPGPGIISKPQQLGLRRIFNPV